MLLLFSPRWLFLYPGIAILAFGGLLAFALLPGPVLILPGVSLDLHSLIVASIAMLIGTQCISFALIARAYASSRRLLPPSPHLTQYLRHITLERILVFSGVLLFAGVIGICYAVYYWSSVHFGAIEYGKLIRVVLLSSTSIALSLQIAFTAFLYSILEIEI
jgi:hypothetical protein